MTENVPPGTGATTASADQPGRPYYESLRSTLRSTIEKKRKLDEQLAALEEQIYKVEGTYLEDTSNSGNIVRGFDAWVKSVTLNKSAADDRRRGRIREDDRIFSRSSLSWMRAQEGPDSGTTSHAATPIASGPSLTARDLQAAAVGSSKAALKKKRPNDDEDDSKTIKRSKITYARD
ncbi:hypothetical protein AMS68_001669 [Peltaster fructicola]|uniref:Chromatin modification-related protein EAF6 n=1 Tax=Peltaster fructicola TaxID=286661 RepID=A0A6H0XN16_9PEZI|nr:hypothetical protein AMS68_001669 [Peltaster fructicola]